MTALIPINIKSSGGFHITLQVYPRDTIRLVKERIQAEVGIHSRRQYLVFDDRELENDHNLIFYNIRASSTIYLLLTRCETLKLNIRTPFDLTLSFDVEPHDTARNIKMLIEWKTGIPRRHQQLLSSGTQLADDGTLSSYGILSDSAIDLILPSTSSPPPSRLPWETSLFFPPHPSPMKTTMTIYVRTLEGRIITLEVEPNEQIGSVKAKIQLKEGVLFSEQRLLFRTELCNGYTLGDYNIRQFDTLRLEPKSMPLNCSARQP